MDKLKIVVEDCIVSNRKEGNSPAQVWEIVKFEIVSFCQEQARYIAKQNKKEITELQYKLEDWKRIVSYH